MNAADRLNEEELSLLAPVMDVPSTLNRLGNDVELFREIVQIYLEDAPQLLATARRSLDAADSQSLRRAAHSLKGLAATLSAANAVSEAFRLEQCGATENFDEALEIIGPLERRFLELNAALEAISQSP